MFHITAFILCGFILFFITPCKIHFASVSNKLINLLFLVAKAAIMVAKNGEQVVTALKSLSSYGLILPEKDQENLEAFIEDLFSNSDDDNRSKDDQVFPVSTKAWLYISVPSFHRVPGKIIKCTSNASKWSWILKLLMMKVQIIQM